MLFACCAHVVVHEVLSTVLSTARCYRKLVAAMCDWLFCAIAVSSVCVHCLNIVLLQMLLHGTSDVVVRETAKERIHEAPGMEGWADLVTAIALNAGSSSAA